MSDNQKIRPLILAKILLKETDESHTLSRDELIDALKNEGINVERKTLYKDIQHLRDSGLDIISEQHGRGIYYFIGQRDFELAELKLLVDLVQASKFITKKKSKSLITKVESLASKYEATELQRQVYVSGRIKADNESIYYNVDKIHMAINQNNKITFKYFQWSLQKEKELRHNGKEYCVSPWALLWDNEKYYLIAYDDNSREIRHYRVDKILNPEIIIETRNGSEIFKKVDMSTYTKQIFGMFEGENRIVKLRVNNSLVGVMIDRFGTDLEITNRNDTFFETDIEVEVSDQFLGWIFSLGNGVEILAPEDARERMIKTINERAKIYKN